MVLMEFHANEIFCAMHISELCRRVVVICAKIAPTRHLAVVSGIISVYCLFSPDIQRITTATGSAGIFDIITFISISIFAIEMAVSGLERVCDCGVRLAFGALVRECAEADGWHAHAIVKREALSC